MIIGPQCQKMLENRCQCPNAAVDGSIWCIVHKQLEESAEASNTMPTNTDATISKEEQAGIPVDPIKET